MFSFVKSYIILKAYKCIGICDTLYRKYCKLFPTTVTKIIYFENDNDISDIVYKPYSLKDLPILNETNGFYLFNVWDREKNDYIYAIINAAKVVSALTTRNLWMFSHRGIAYTLEKYLQDHSKNVQGLLVIKANGADVTKIVKPYHTSLWIPDNINAKALCTITSYLSNKTVVNSYTDKTFITEKGNISDTPIDEVVYMNEEFEEVSVKGEKFLNSKNE